MIRGHDDGVEIAKIASGKVCSLENFSPGGVLAFNSSSFNVVINPAAAADFRALGGFEWAFASATPPLR